jgi:hypothetical protein
MHTVMTRVKYHLPPNGNSMYIGCPDSTLSGSRNGTTALVFWDFFASNSYEALEKRATKCMMDAEYQKRERVDQGRDSANVCLGA